MPGTSCSPDGGQLGPVASPVPRLAAFTWQTATPASQGLDGAKLNAMRQTANGTRILLVARSNTVRVVF